MIGRPLTVQREIVNRLISRTQVGRVNQRFVELVSVFLYLARAIQLQCVVVI